jgi:hypothetical protein
MERRLVNPLDTAFNKRLAYGVLLLVDVLAAAVISEPPPLGFTLDKRATIFCLIHLFAVFWLIECITPWKESVESWVWRFRGRSNRLLDSLVGERSENGAVLVAFAALGLLSLSLFVVLPDVIREGISNLMAHEWTVVPAALTMVLMILTWGTFSQWFVFVAGRNGKTLTLAIIVGLVVPLHVTGVYYQSDAILAMTPSAHFADWLMGTPHLNLTPLFAVYGLMLILVWMSLRRGLAALTRSVDRKLERMGVVAWVLPVDLSSERGALAP